MATDTSKLKALSWRAILKLKETTGWTDAQGEPVIVNSPDGFLLFEDAYARAQAHAK